MFKPLNIKQQEFIDVPLFNLLSFTLYELDNQGLRTVMHGDSATKFADRYVAKNVDFTDNSRKYILNTKANSATYKNDILTLEGDVVCSRDDGLVFKTQNLSYNKTTSIIATKEQFIAYTKYDDKIEGTSFSHNNDLKKGKARRVLANYKLEEK